MSGNGSGVSAGDAKEAAKTSATKNTKALTEGIEKPPIPSGRSICHPVILRNKLVFVSLDLKTGGENCGIIQLSTKIVRLEINREKEKTAKDTLRNVFREGTVYHERDNPRGGEFNEYVNPGEDAEWSSVASEITGLSRTDPRITSAREIGPVWHSFCKWINTNIAKDEHGVIVAYNGAGSDMKWIWRLTQAPNAPNLMPLRLDYYMDPYMMIKKWKSCPLNLNSRHQKSLAFNLKLQSLKLGAVWSHINDGESLVGAHDSLVDVRAQTDLMLHKSFSPFLDRTESFVPIGNIFRGNQLRKMKRDLEPVRPAHAPWQELTTESLLSWEPHGPNEYLGSQGGGTFGPSSAIKQVARAAQNLATLFFFILPMSFFIQVAMLSDKYCYTDWVVEKFGKDRDGNRKKRRYFEDLTATQAPRERDKRHRGDKDKEKF